MTSAFKKQKLDVSESKEFNLGKNLISTLESSGCVLNLVWFIKEVGRSHNCYLRWDGTKVPVATQSQSSCRLSPLCSLITASW